MIRMFSNMVINGEFQKAYELMANIPFSQVRDILHSIAYDNESICSYSFVCFLLLQKETGEYHILASEVLSMGLNHMPNAYNAALFHAKKALEFCPNNISYKEYLLFFYSIPDKLLPSDEALSIAREIIEVDPNNKAANEIINF